MLKISVADHSMEIISKQEENGNKACRGSINHDYLPDRFLPEVGLEGTKNSPNCMPQLCFHGYNGAVSRGDVIQ